MAAFLTGALPCKSGGRRSPSICARRCGLWGQTYTVQDSTAQSAQRTIRMQISSNDFRPGMTIELDGVVHKVVEFLHVKPGKGAAFVRTKLKNMQTGNSVERTFRAGETVPQAVLDKVTMQHTYRDGGEFVFMNMESFEEERLPAALLGNGANYMKEGLDVEVLKHQGKVLDVDLPKTMTLEVVETDPGVKGNTAQGGSKPATLETGAVIQVPLFIKIGEKIKVDTFENKYLSRSKE